MFTAAETELILGCLRWGVDADNDCVTQLPPEHPSVEDARANLRLYPDLIRKLEAGKPAPSTSQETPMFRLFVQHDDDRREPVPLRPFATREQAEAEARNMWFAFEDEADKARRNRTVSAYNGQLRETSKIVVVPDAPDVSVIGRQRSLSHLTGPERLYGELRQAYERELAAFGKLVAGLALDAHQEGYRLQAEQIANAALHLATRAASVSAAAAMLAEV